MHLAICVNSIRILRMNSLFRKLLPLSWAASEKRFDAIPITQNYILQLHKILYSHMNNPMAGRTKSVQNYISATYPDGHVETLFTPLAPYETPKALDRICEEYNRVIGNNVEMPERISGIWIWCGNGNPYKACSADLKAHTYQIQALDPSGNLIWQM